MDSMDSNWLRTDLAENLAFVRRVALAIVRDENAADDLAQDVMCAALERAPIHKSGSIEAMRAWLSVVARRLAIDRARSESARRARERSVSRPERAEGDGGIVERMARSQRIVEAVMKLDEPYRSTLLLRYLEELTIAEVAQRTGASEPVVRKRLGVGLRTLRAELDAEFGEETSAWALALLATRSSSSAVGVTSGVGILAALQGFVLMNTKWVATAVVAALIGVFLWQRNAEPVAPSVASASTRVTEVAVDREAGAKSAESNRAALGVTSGATPATPAVASSKPFLIVRSSVGLPLPFAELQTPDGDWIQADLDHDHCAVDASIALPCLVRAPGHVAKVASKFGEELVLEPDALLTFEADELHQRTQVIRVEDPYGPYGSALQLPSRRACAFGWLSDDTWCVAVSHDLIPDAPEPHELSVEVLWPDHRRTSVHFNAIGSARATWRVPCDGHDGGAPLHVHVERVRGEAQGDIVLRMYQRVSFSADGALERFAWGSVYDHPRHELWMDRQSMPAGESDYTLDHVPEGVQLVIGARDEASSAYGRLVFAHDGTSRTLQLRPAFVLNARLLAAEDSTPVRRAQVSWEFRDGPETKYSWRSENPHLTADPEGYFETRGPTDAITRVEVPLDPPSKLVLSIRAPGFEAFERSFETGGAPRLDCGELRLTRRAPEITLAPGHGVAPKFVEYTILRVSSHPAFEWACRSATVMNDGSLALYLNEVEDSAKSQHLLEGWNVQSGEQLQLSWTDDSAEFLTLRVELGDHSEDWLFRRQVDGRYAAMPRLAREIKLDCESVPPGEGDWSAGWQWHEQWGTCERLSHPRVGTVTRVRTSAPEGATFWWSACRRPPGVLGAPTDVGGTCPLDGVRKFVLR
jgi:RNA polymerase sigma factor (sigma-70 family)